MQNIYIYMHYSLDNLTWNVAYYGTECKIINYDITTLNLWDYDDFIHLLNQLWEIDVVSCTINSRIKFNGTHKGVNLLISKLQSILAVANLLAHNKGPSRSGLFCISTSDADANWASASQNWDAFRDPVLSGSVHLRTSVSTVRRCSSVLPAFIERGCFWRAPLMAKIISNRDAILLLIEEWRRDIK